MAADRHVRALVMVTVLVCALLAATAGTATADSLPPGKWKAETLDQGNSTGVYTSTAYYPVYEQHHVFSSTWKYGMDSGESRLRHGWFQPGFGTWLFETLDAGNSTGLANTTVYYPLYQQHHVFNEGTESGLPVLRHGWFQPGYDTWAFETLDEGVSTGNGIATVIFGDQHHVFNRGTESGQDVLRHGVFDPASGTWTFESFDPRPSHSNCVNRGAGAAIVGSDGNLNWFGGMSCRGYIVGEYSMHLHAWLDSAGWHYEWRDWLEGLVAVTTYHGHTEVFDRDRVGGGWCRRGCLSHSWWDGAWHSDYPDLDLSTGFWNSTSTYPTYDQLHVFNEGGGGIRHAWYQPAW